MPNKKTTRRNHYTVDGDTECWYLEWLAKKINNSSDAICRVSVKGKKKTPLKYVKSENFLKKTIITNLCDTESNGDEHTNGFISKT